MAHQEEEILQQIEQIQKQREKTRRENELLLLLKHEQDELEKELKQREDLMAHLKTKNMPCDVVSEVMVESSEIKDLSNVKNKKYVKNGATYKTKIKRKHQVANRDLHRSFNEKQEIVQGQKRSMVRGTKVKRLRARKKTYKIYQSHKQNTPSYVDSHKTDKITKRVQECDNNPNLVILPQSETDGCAISTIKHDENIKKEIEHKPINEPNYKSIIITKDKIWIEICGNNINRHQLSCPSRPHEQHGSKFCQLLFHRTGRHCLNPTCLGKAICPTHQNEQEIKQRLIGNCSMHGLKFSNMTPADGDCFFHAISDQLRRLQLPDKSPQCLRSEVAEYISQNRIFQEENGSIILNDFVEGDFVKYCTNMRKSGVYADHVVVFGMAKMLQRNINIVTSSPQATVDSCLLVIEGKKDSTDDPILLGHYWEHHYQSLEVFEEIVTQTRCTIWNGLRRHNRVAPVLVAEDVTNTDETVSKSLSKHCAQLFVCRRSSIKRHMSKRKKTSWTEAVQRQLLSRNKVEPEKKNNGCQQFGKAVAKDKRIISEIFELKRGYHVKYKRMRNSYSHHAIVTSVDPQSGTYTIINFAKEERNSMQRPKIILQTKRFKSNEMFRVIYSIDFDHENLDKIAERAECSLTLPIEKYNIFRYNCEHFATYCVTNRKQSRQADKLKKRLRTITLYMGFVPEQSRCPYLCCNFLLRK